jgi:hypothetical protein
MLADQTPLRRIDRLETRHYLDENKNTCVFVCSVSCALDEQQLS